ncbi:MAG: hypothetical protein N2167_00765 [Flavobacteriales bacterium]|nr:hypothetical protein [Flavobacteriales bacterium]
MNFGLSFIFLLWLNSAISYSQIPLPGAHAHNDYMNEHPLMDALELGFTSIEIDVCLYKNTLRVSHNPIFLSFKQTLQELYLDPLVRRIQQNGGRVYAGYDAPLVLMIDLKGDGNKSYPVLRQLLKPYKHLLTIYRKDSVFPGPIQINISGNVPVDLIRNELERWVTIDGSVSKGLDSIISPMLVQRVSSPYRHFFKWRGMGKQPPDEKRVMDSLAHIAQLQHKELRFYAAGNNKKVWKALIDAGVYWINVDDLRKFYDFRLNYKPQKNR